MKKNINEETLAESLSKTIENDLVKIQEVLDLDLKNLVDVVVEEGDNVANDILFKVIGHHDRKLELPIDVNILKKYCFSTDLREEQFYDTLMWIALRYFAISESISYYQWKDKYEKDLKSSN